MSFSNQVISDLDLKRYTLPFPRGSKRTWTRDEEGDYYLWGGLQGNPMLDGWLEGVFTSNSSGCDVD